jgi:predicted Zn-dependent protease
MRLYQKYPDNPLYADTLGWVLFSQGHVDQGLELLRRAAQQLPEEPQVRYHVGVALYKKGDFNGAAQELTKALAPKKEFDGVDQARKLMQHIAVKGK